MGICLGVKSKHQQHNQNNSTLIQESQLKRSEGANLLTKQTVVETINSDQRVENLTTSTLYKSKADTLPEETKSPSLSRRIFKGKKLSKCAVLTSTVADDLDSESSSISPPFKASTWNTTQGLPVKSILPPISIYSSSFSSDHPDRYTPGLCGLNNIGNTCFMNSAIQCLNSVPDLTQWIMQQRPRRSHMNVIDVYICLVQLMWSGRHVCVTPRELKECVSMLAPIFSDYGQKDSHEFMNSLLNAIETVDSSSYLLNLFRIYTQSKVTCNKCQYFDITKETTTFLSLPVPQIKSHDYTKILLEDLIKDFCHEDELNGRYYCQKCKQYQSARQKTTITQPLPRAVIIQLKRFPFDGTDRKINTLVEYKLKHQNLLSNNDQYDLCAVSMHSGNLAGGHYTTMARNYMIDKWYRFDDSYIEEIDPKIVLVTFTARQAYVLVYLKRDD